MDNTCSFESIAAAIAKHQNFLVISHFRPDGDAIGCSLALTHVLKALQKNVVVWNEDGLPERFGFLPGAEWLQPSPNDVHTFDAVILVDTAVRNRAGQNTIKAAGAPTCWINIDHHVSNDRLGDLVYVDSDAPAAGQILFELFSSSGYPITKEIAICLYAAISTDTGSFQFPSTTARTYEIVAQLIRFGVDVGWINQQLYGRNPRRRIELLRSMLNVLQFSGNERVASFSLSQQTAQELQIIADDTEGLIDTIRALDGVVVAAFFEELPTGEIRISLRSKDQRVNVCEICAEFGGGGHRLAAGARLPGPLAQAQQRVLSTINHHLQQALD